MKMSMTLNTTKGITDTITKNHQHQQPSRMGA